ncbi:Pyridoxal phosphate homeostasis protein [BD1-7 clade bacterium]|uniref:Pyridoxal phosphate homeostasis protein n=1 Tax=BD1-7 clade bacterium TaxID=2029982 RepID=A0A5S9N4Y4_9GAMM|nr:Pyridoxal phosphate homeostasis protein [BD1-7 clade bacterium]
MPTIEDNIVAMKNRIHSNCRTAERSANSVKLLAVSKTQPIEKIQQAMQTGQLAFGENYATEAADKIEQLPETLEWHFIGPIQSNKSRLIAEKFDWVHSIDRAKLIRRLNEQRPDGKPPLNCLIQVNISEEPTKSGCLPTEIDTLAVLINSADKLCLKGLMAIPRPHEQGAQSADDFARMQTLSQQLQRQYPEATELSMGMSNDMHTAIQHGATIVRIGTAIFGQRPTPAHKNIDANIIDEGSPPSSDTTTD